MINCTFEDGGKGSKRHVTVDVLLLKDNKLLLVKRAKRLLEGGKWASVGGFVDRDETLLEAAKREVFEESGWRIKELTLFRIKDNPNRKGEDRQNISFSFFATVTVQEGEKDDESDEMVWFDLENLPPGNEIAFDHESDINLYKKYLKEKFSLPLALK